MAFSPNHIWLDPPNMSNERFQADIWWVIGACNEAGRSFNERRRNSCILPYWGRYCPLGVWWWHQVVKLYLKLLRLSSPYTKRSVDLEQLRSGARCTNPQLIHSTVDNIREMTLVEKSYATLSPEFFFLALIRFVPIALRPVKFLSQWKGNHATYMQYRENRKENYSTKISMVLPYLLRIRNGDKSRSQARQQT